MTWYRLKIEEVDGRAVTSYTRWVDAVQVRGAENEQVCVTFSPRFEHIWLESKKHLLESAVRKPPHMDFAAGTPSAVRLGERAQLSWNQTHYFGTTSHSAWAGFGKDADGEVIKEALLAVWGNLRQRALDVAIAEINVKTDLNIALESVKRSKHRRVTALIFAIKSQAMTALA